MSGRDKLRGSCPGWVRDPFEADRPSGHSCCFVDGHLRVAWFLVDNQFYDKMVGGRCNAVSQRRSCTRRRRSTETSSFSRMGGEEISSPLRR